MEHFHIWTSHNSSGRTVMQYFNSLFITMGTGYCFIVRQGLNFLTLNAAKSLCSVFIFPWDSTILFSLWKFVPRPHQNSPWTQLWKILSPHTLDFRIHLFQISGSAVSNVRETQHCVNYRNYTRSAINSSYMNTRNQKHHLEGTAIPVGENCAQIPIPFSSVYQSFLIIHPIIVLPPKDTLWFAKFCWIGSFFFFWNRR